MQTCSKEIRVERDVATLSQLTEFFKQMGPHAPSVRFNDQIYSVRKDKQVVGVGQLTTEAGTFLLQEVRVLPGYRGRGIGSAILRKLIRETKRFGIRTLFLVVNHHIASFYESVGFRIVYKVNGVPPRLQERAEQYRSLFHNDFVIMKWER